MKKYVILFSVFLLFLSGCGSEKDFERYIRMTQTLRTNNNYSIEEYQGGTASTYEYTADRIHYVNSDTDAYFYADGEVYYALIYDSENGIYIKAEADYDEHYFYPYELMERLSKLGGYVNTGELRYKFGAFSGDSFTGAYLYKGALHRPLEMLIEIENDLPVYFYEKYESGGITYEDEIRIRKAGTTHVSLPLNVFDETELKELKKLQEKQDEEAN